VKFRFVLCDVMVHVFAFLFNYIIQTGFFHQPLDSNCALLVAKWCAPASSFGLHLAPQ